MDTSRSPAEEAVDQVIAGLAGPTSRDALIAAAVSHYRGDARTPKQSIASHLRYRSDVVQIRPGCYERLERIMDGAYFRLTLTPLFIEFPWVPSVFLTGYLALRQPHAQLVDERNGSIVPVADPHALYSQWRDRPRERSTRRAGAPHNMPGLLQALMGDAVGVVPGPWGPILSIGNIVGNPGWRTLEPILNRHKARPGDALIFRVDAALEDRVSVWFHGASRHEDALTVQRSRELADRLAQFLESERNEIPAREAVPASYVELPWIRDVGAPAEHWWIVAEMDPRLRTVDGKAIASSSYYRREDWTTGRPQPERPDVSTAPAEEAGKEYQFKVSLEWKSGVWRLIALRGDQTLEDLHDAIQDAFGWDNDHLYAFYLSGKAWDDSSEYGDPRGESEVTADQAAVGALGLRKNKPFLYIFDFGDELRHEVRLVEVRELSPRKNYPRVVEKHGRAPKQYREEW